MSDIVPYKEQKLERISGTELVNSKLLMQKPSRFFIASPVYVGKHNQVGFVIVDREPRKRPFWIGSDILSYSSEDIEKEIKQFKACGMGIPEERRYFYDMSQGGMAALRYFAISQSLMDIFEKDDFLGPAMLRKICEEAAVPKEFDEMAVTPEVRDSIKEYSTGSDRSGLTLILQQALSPLEERTGTTYSPNAYVTYFPSTAYPIIVPTLEESVKGVIARFDQFGDKFKLIDNHPDVNFNSRLLE